MSDWQSIWNIFLADFCFSTLLLCTIRLHLLLFLYHLKLLCSYKHQVRITDLALPLCFNTTNHLLYSTLTFGRCHGTTCPLEQKGTCWLHYQLHAWEQREDLHSWYGGSESNGFELFMPYCVLAYFPKYWPQMPTQRYKGAQMVFCQITSRSLKYTITDHYINQSYFVSSGKSFNNDVPQVGLLTYD